MTASCWSSEETTNLGTQLDFVHLILLLCLSKTGYSLRVINSIYCPLGRVILIEFVHWEEVEDQRMEGKKS